MELVVQRNQDRAMKNVYNKIDKSEIYDFIINGLNAKCEYFHCEIPHVCSSDEELIESLSCAHWINYADESISSSEKRGIKLLAKFQPSVFHDSAVLVGICDCSYSRELLTSVEIDTDYPECKVSVDEIKPQMTEQEYAHFYHSSIEGSDDEKEMSPMIVECKTLPVVPKCETCHGLGHVDCEYCHGHGNGECPDCHGNGRLFPNGKWGETHYFRNKIGFRLYDQRVCTLETCPSCKGSGDFKCEVCDGSGQTICKECGGSGWKNNGKRAQEVKRMSEKYTIAKDCFVSMPMDVFNLSASYLRKILVDTQNHFNNKSQIASLNAILEDAKKIGCEDYAINRIRQIMESPEFFAINVAFEKLENIRVVKFTFKDDDYSILVVGNHAFISWLPEVSFFEKLFGKYK